MAAMDRRELLSSAAGWAAGACGLGCGWGLVWPSKAQAARGAEAPGVGADKPRREIDFYTQLADKRIQCFVCPLHCKLNDGETCFCRTRTNYGGRLFTDAYENPCIIATDPIEKLPLNHYLPGSKTLTIACGGCNLRCLYCQNWQQSQVRPKELKMFRLTPAEAVEGAASQGIRSIAFGYTEPVVFLEYAKDIAKLAKQRGLRVVVATAAFVDPEPLLDFAQQVDAFVVALKAFDEDLYHRTTGVRLEPVKTALETIKTKTKCWLEIVNLVVPTYNDGPKMIAGMSAWIAQRLGRDVPVHFARFVPMYRLEDLPRTSVQTLEQAVAVARRAGLRYVYTSNIAPHKDNDTCCPNCHAVIIKRLGFKVLEDRAGKGACPQCRRALPGVWA